jgi:hypothetical protein
MYVKMNRVGQCGLDSYGLGWGPEVWSCEHGKEPSGLTKVGDFLTNWVAISFWRRTLQDLVIKMQGSGCT